MAVRQTAHHDPWRLWRWPVLAKLRRADWVGAAFALAVFLALAIPISHLMRRTRPVPVAVAAVTQHDRHFYPDSLTVARGTVVHITNNDRFTHHVYV